jgi:hypothetical protein
MKEKHLTKEICRIKTKYFNYYSLRLLIGSLFLTLPTCSVILLAGLWENFDFLWVPLLFGIAGWVLVLPLTYAIPRLSKERVAVDALSMGFIGMLCLCSVMLPLKYTSLTHTVGDKSPEISEQFLALFDFKEREKEYLKQIHFLIEELQKEEQK